MSKGCLLESSDLAALLANLITMRTIALYIEVPFQTKITILKPKWAHPPQSIYLNSGFMSPIAAFSLSPNPRSFPLRSLALFCHTQEAA